MANAPPSERKAHRRWFRITPDRVVALLMALEVFLLLSERLEWFALNQHKGYAVLIAAVAAGGPCRLCPCGSSSPWSFGGGSSSASARCSCWRWSLPSFAVGSCRSGSRREDSGKRSPRFGHFAGRLPTTTRRMLRRTAWRIAGKGPPVPPWPPEPPGPAWARRWLGDDFFADVVHVGYSTGVLLIGSVPITDAWLEHIGKITRLRVLNLRMTEVSDAGLKKIEGLTRLRDLNLCVTTITDAGLESVGKLTGLEVLNLMGDSSIRRGPGEADGAYAASGIRPRPHLDRRRRPGAHRKAGPPGGVVPHTYPRDGRRPEAVNGVALPSADRSSENRSDRGRREEA